MNDTKNLFLAKLQNVLKLLDEIDDMIDSNPEQQQNCDFEISDYLHLIQYNDEQLTMEQKSLICDKISKVRSYRVNVQVIQSIGKVYRDNIHSLLNKERRQFLYNSISKALKVWNESDYNYRVLSEQDVNNILSYKSDIENKVVEKKHRITIDKDTLKEMLDKKMKQCDIAEQFGITPGRVSQLVVKYGLSKRKGDK